MRIEVRVTTGNLWDGNVNMIHKAILDITDYEFVNFIGDPEDLFRTKMTELTEQIIKMNGGKIK